MSYLPLVSPGTRLLATLENATKRPSAEIAVAKLQLFPWTPFAATLSRLKDCAATGPASVATRRAFRSVVFMRVPFGKAPASQVLLHRASTSRPAGFSRAMRDRAHASVRTRTRETLHSAPPPSSRRGRSVAPAPPRRSQLPPFRPRRPRRQDRARAEDPPARFPLGARTFARRDAGLARVEARAAGPRQLPAPRRDRARRHGRHPQGSRHRSRARRRGQGPRSRARPASRSRPAFRRRGTDRRTAPAPGHRPGVRARPDGGRAPLLHDEVGQGAHARVALQAAQDPDRQPRTPPRDLR